LQVDLETCIRCDRCQTVCPVDIRVYETPASGACIRCLECIPECPVDCISVASPHWSPSVGRNDQPSETTSTPSSGAS
jgi:ferredoxin